MHLHLDQESHLMYSRNYIPKQLTRPEINKNGFNLRVNFNLDQSNLIQPILLLSQCHCKKYNFVASFQMVFGMWYTLDVEGFFGMDIKEVSISRSHA